ncbi:hypothetical protein PAXINDRAFT_16613 [Paxillus involutus ATCC 200175]|uniref:Uncharacterized protein n=1 Tax=Paxillus involutus ATCC 200175 TaxID=664439 RepID=A0A0C9TT29_PAXIN|nr:hypothetical protein PAXINDRAFT_16613 [Paxillus involutus ATCC 200175]
MAPAQLHLSPAILATNFIILTLISFNMLLASNALLVHRDGNNTEDTPTFKDFAFDPIVNKQGPTNDTLLTITNELNFICTLQKSMSADTSLWTPTLVISGPK